VGTGKSRAQAKRFISPQPFRSVASYIPGPPNREARFFERGKPVRVRIFLDFWNFQLNWNDRTAKAQID